MMGRSLKTETPISCCRRSNLVASGSLWTDHLFVTVSQKWQTEIPCHCLRHLGNHLLWEVKLKAAVSPTPCQQPFILMQSLCGVRELSSSEVCPRALPWLKSGIWFRITTLRCLTWSHEALLKPCNQLSASQWINCNQLQAASGNRRSTSSLKICPAGRTA